MRALIKIEIPIHRKSALSMENFEMFLTTIHFYFIEKLYFKILFEGIFSLSHHMHSRDTQNFEFAM